MNKRNAAAAAAGGEEGSSGSANGGSGGESTGHGRGDDDDEDVSTAGFSLLKGLQAAPELTSAGDDRAWELRDPFADYDDDDDDDDGRGGGAGDGSGSDDGRDDGDVGARSGGWNRGSWWRGVVRTARRGGAKGVGDREKFGDGRDSDDSGEEGEVDEDMDDEEFGDFAMPESGAVGTTGSVTGIDPAREKVLLKPLPVHPATSKSGSSPFGSLWPFSTQAFGVGSKDKGKGEDEAATEAPGAGSANRSKDSDAAAGSPQPEPDISAEPLELEVDETVVGEDGKKIDRAVEAKRRTSIEDPDEDDVGTTEVVIGRGDVS